MIRSNQTLSVRPLLINGARLRNFLITYLGKNVGYIFASQTFLGYEILVNAYSYNAKLIISQVFAPYLCACYLP